MPPKIGELFTQICWCAHLIVMMYIWLLSFNPESVSHGPFIMHLRDVSASRNSTDTFAISAAFCISDLGLGTLWK